MFCHLGLFCVCVCWRVCYLKGCSLGALGVHRGWVIMVAAPSSCTWGRGREGAMAPAPLCRISVTPSATHNQIGPLWCWFPSGWACARSRPLWVSPVTSPVRLGVSSAATPTPTDVFNQRFEALFPLAGALGCLVCFAPHRSSWFICARMWGRGVCYPLHCLPRSPPL